MRGADSEYIFRAKRKMDGSPRTGAGITTVVVGITIGGGAVRTVITGDTGLIEMTGGG